MSAGWFARCACADDEKTKLEEKDEDEKSDNNAGGGSSPTPTAAVVIAGHLASFHGVILFRLAKTIIPSVPPPPKKIEDIRTKSCGPIKCIGT